MAQFKICTKPTYEFFEACLDVRQKNIDTCILLMIEQLKSRLQRKAH